MTRQSLPNISPDRVLGNESSRVISARLLKGIGRAVFDGGGYERASTNPREQAVYNRMVENVSAFTNYWDDFLGQRGDRLNQGLSGIARLKNGVGVTFKGATYDHSQGELGGRGANWEFDVQSVSGGALHIELATVNYRKGEKSGSAVAARDISQMRSLVFSEGESGHPITSYPPKERLEGYETVCEIMESIKSAHQTGDVELLN